MSTITGAPPFQSASVPSHVRVDNQRESAAEGVRANPEAGLHRVTQAGSHAQLAGVVTKNNN